MKIAFVNNQFQLGGAETVIAQIRKGLSEHGIEHDLFVAEGKHCPQDVRMLYPRILNRLSYTRLGSWVDKFSPRYICTDKAFRRLAHGDADMVHLHNFHGIYASIDSLAYLVGRKPVVWTFHAFWGITGGCDHPKGCSRYLETCGRCPQLGVWPLGNIDHTAAQLREKIEKLSARPFHVIAPSQHLKDKVHQSRVGVNWDVHHIPNGICLKSFSSARKKDPQFRKALGLSPDKITVLIVNRNFRDPNKGFPVVLDAFRYVASFKNKIQIILAGVYSDWAYQQISPFLNAVDLGYIADREHLAKIYEASDVMVFASQAENFPCVILEAMASGCCIVSTPTSGVTEQIESGRSGIISESISGESLGRVLNQVLSEPQQIASLGDSAMARVSSLFSEEVMIEKHIRLYKNILSNDCPHHFSS